MSTLAQSRSTEMNFNKNSSRSGSEHSANSSNNEGDNSLNRTFDVEKGKRDVFIEKVLDKCKLYLNISNINQTKITRKLALTFKRKVSKMLCMNISLIF